MASIGSSKCDAVKARRRPQIPAKPKHECDLVMKGGITSGVVYPSAVLELAERYRFRNIGGTSVGAIAAALVAAAEYGRQNGSGTGFAELETLNEELQRPDFLLSLFQPQPRAGAAFELLVASMKDPNAKLRKILRILWLLIRHSKKITVPALALWLGSQVALGIVLGHRWWILAIVAGAWAALIGIGLAVRAKGVARKARAGFLGTVVGALAVLLWPLAVAPISIASSFYGELNRQGFGMCPGTAQGDSPQALTEWLHAHLQRTAGRKADDPLEGLSVDSRPLTFGDLNVQGIDLQMMTTNLSTARPVRLPIESEEYFFKEEDLAFLFPPRVVRHMLQVSPKPTDPGLGAMGFLRMPPAKDLPVLVGFRMSLSFPVLFTGVRLYGLHPARPEQIVPNWFSDGGIGSNFPIHFFDAWVPERPTFGLSLGQYPQGPDGKPVPGEGDIGEPVPPNSFALPNWVRVSSIAGFLQQILDTMQNWRDTMQAELPGFQDRVYQVRLSKDEGGMNLAMPTEAICDLILKGGAAGAAIKDTFDWNQHFFTRYVTFMQMMQIGLAGQNRPGITRRNGVLDNFEAFRDAFERGNPEVKERFGHDAGWCREAGVDTWELAERAKGWVRAANSYRGAFVGFDSGSEPRPTPAMRVLPRV